MQRATQRSSLFDSDRKDAMAPPATTPRRRRTALVGALALALAALVPAARGDELGGRPPSSERQPDDAFGEAVPPPAIRGRRLGSLDRYRFPETTERRQSATAPADDAADDAGGTLSPDRLRAVRAEATGLIGTLDGYYSGRDRARRMLMGAWLDPWDLGGETAVAEPPAPAEEDSRRRLGLGRRGRGKDKRGIKRPWHSRSRQQRLRSSKLVDTMARALVTDEQNAFVIGTIGSSVAAGHDNCRYDSYEEQLRRTLGPVWDAAGMTLEVQNAGQGGGCGDDYKNQAFCLGQNVSPEIDVAHYTWTYFEAGDFDGKVAARESLVRWAQMLPHQPPVHVINVQHLPDPHREPKEYDLPDRYAAYGYNAFYMKSGYANGGYDYERAVSERGVDHFSWGHVGDGYHNATRYGEDEPDPLRRESLGVVMRNWHPGPLAFQFVSDAFAYLYAEAVLRALDLIEAEVGRGRDPRDRWSASGRPVLLGRSLPDPLYCDPEYCVVDEAPGCLNFELPTYGRWGARVEDPYDVLNPHAGELQAWEVYHQQNDWDFMVGKLDAAVFQNREDRELCRHLDQCGGISALSAQNGMVVFRLPKMEVGLVAICGCCGKDVAPWMFLENEFLEVRYNGVLLDRSSWDLYPTGKCARLLRRFPRDVPEAMTTPTGHAYLSVKALEGLAVPVRISHVITL